MRIQLLGEVSGTRNGQQWPPRLSTLDLPDDEALALIEQRMARPVVEVTEGRGVVDVVEDSRVIGDPALPEVAAAAPVNGPGTGEVVVTAARRGRRP